MQLSEIPFKNHFVNQFPGDKTGNLQSRQTPGMLYSLAIPTPVPNPKLISWNKELAKDLKLNFPSKKDLQILAGNSITTSMKPFAACYGGHQFGNWAGQLGDGRAISLGEKEDPQGNTLEFQLKGSGPTAYSRGADGKAVLRSSVREYLISEAMHFLGVPSTRALSLLTSGDDILRDMFYDGNPKYEPGAIICRTSPSFLRFGNFEILSARNEIENLKKLTHWTIEKYFPQLRGENLILDFFREIVESTATLMVEWYRVGFVHGVMNTDNMSILGLTIDYGPFSFLDDYDVNFTPNTTDLPGRRYAFGNQPSVAYWNLGKMASALLPLFENSTELETILHNYEVIFWEKYYEMMQKKLGLDACTSENKSLITQLENILAILKPDMSIFYRVLIDVPLEASETEILSHFKDCFYTPPISSVETDFIQFIKNYSSRIKENKYSRETSQAVMRKNNPKFILRNYLLQQAIEELETGNNSLFLKLEKALRDPYSEEATEFFSKRPDWALEKAGCSMLSCSS